MSDSNRHNHALNPDASYPLSRNPISVERHHEMLQVRTSARIKATEAFDATANYKRHNEYTWKYRTEAGSRVKAALDLQSVRSRTAQKIPNEPIDSYASGQHHTTRANDLRVITQEPNKFISKAEYLKAFEENGPSRFFQDRNCFSKTKTETRSPENCMGSGGKTRSRSSVRRSYTPIILQHSTASCMPHHAPIQPSLHNIRSPHIPQGTAPSHHCCPSQLHIDRSKCSEDIFSDTSSRLANVFSQPPYENIRRDSFSEASIRDVELAPRISKGSLSFVLNPDSSHNDRQAEHQRTSKPVTHRESLGFPDEIRGRRIANLETRPSRLQEYRLSTGPDENMRRNFSREACNQSTSHLYSPPKSISPSSAGHWFQSPFQAPSNSQIPTVSCRNTWPSVAMKMENAVSFSGLPISRHHYPSYPVQRVTLTAAAGSEAVKSTRPKLFENSSPAPLHTAHTTRLKTLRNGATGNKVPYDLLRVPYTQSRKRNASPLPSLDSKYSGCEEDLDEEAPRAKRRAFGRLPPDIDSEESDSEDMNYIVKDTLVDGNSAKTLSIGHLRTDGLGLAMRNVSATSAASSAADGADDMQSSKASSLETDLLHSRPTEAKQMARATSEQSPFMADSTRECASAKKTPHSFHLSPMVTELASSRQIQAVRSYRKESAEEAFATSKPRTQTPESISGPTHGLKVYVELPRRRSLRLLSAKKK